MDERWTWNRFKLRVAAALMILCGFHHTISLCWSLNNEGLALLRFKERVMEDPFDALSSWNFIKGELDPCSWLGVECSDGQVVVLNLTDLCLGGILGPELGQLTHIRAILLRNNSFSGIIPTEIGELKELEVLDLRHNNFTGPFPLNFGSNLSLTYLLLDNNKYFGSNRPKIYDLQILSESHTNKKQLPAASSSSLHRQSKLWKGMQSGDVAKRRLLQEIDNHLKALSSISPSPSPLISSGSRPLSGQPHSSISLPPSISDPRDSIAPSASEFMAPSPSPNTLAPQAPINPHVVPHPHEPHHSSQVPLPSPASVPHKIVETKSKSQMIIILSAAIGGSLFVLVSAIGIIYCQRTKVVTVKPWTTGLSGQLQKAFVTGVPKLQRSELETACEDFSNIIGSLPDGTVYKGTLSSGVEIAVTSSSVKSAEDWSENLESRFRNKIETLSKVNHKNFVNLIGYCEEQKPFTRMMVFEYAPNGTLFEHLHIRESEHLDWGMRLRVAMGIAYCLEYLHQLKPPIAHGNLQSSSVYLTEDFAAKLSDFSFWNDVIATKMGSRTTELLDISSADPESNVYSFGLILFEIITGKIPNALSGALDYLREGRPLSEMVDPTLKSFRGDELEKLFALAKECLLADHRKRPTMREVTAKLKEITAMGPDVATPKSSPLWWAEIEILSAESS